MIRSDKEKQMIKIPVILDTDPGVDDFMAIMLANSSDRLDIKAVTVVAGNQTLKKTSKNALDIASFLNMKTRIAKGAEKPVNKEIEIADEVHGESGIGSVVLPDGNLEFDSDYAWDVMYQEAVKAEGKLQIIAVGPLTNVAVAILKYRDLKKYVDRIVLMGGSTDYGNNGVYSEFNIWEDSFAADIVFKSEIPVTMVGLNVTMNTVLTESHIKELKSIKSAVSKEAGELLDSMSRFYRSLGRDFIPLHDALAVAGVISPSLLECRDYYVAVETRRGLNEGRTVVDIDRSHRDRLPNASVAVKGNTEMFVDMLRKMLEYYQ